MAIALRPPTAETLASLATEGPDASLGAALNRQIASRAVVTAFGAGSAWAVGRFTGTRGRANTIALLAMVGTQLGQTVTSGRFSKEVITTGVATLGALAVIVQTPFLSQAFGCRPIGPVGWCTALGASVFATSAGIYAPRIAHEIWQNFVSTQPGPLSPQALPSPLTIADPTNLAGRGVS
jgi:cation-transporting ATPase I